tara:strand:+ start:1188 stop:1370 length:183 start_codon:yes stop_codon:yes gene_type:complete
MRLKLNWINNIFEAIGNIFSEFVDLIIFIKNVVQFLIILGIAGAGYYFYLNYEDILNNLP